ncbi:MAG: chemotaxis protein CheA [Candidatus Delongbacteria bacterium]|nr:chemotaxis protein CheA [Candidatus Delongbacteria bacterium]MBN2834059.1 chemotaxis protein CheA [Candidatus Delongbacteria bacterium]
MTDNNDLLIEDKDMLDDFVAEGNEMIDEVEIKLLELQQSVEARGDVDKELLDSVFRLFHTIKGTSGFFNLNNLKNVTHEAETLLDRIRKGKTKLEFKHTALFLEGADFLRKLLIHISDKMTDSGYEEEANNLINKFISVSDVDSSTGSSERKKKEPTTKVEQESPVKEKNINLDLNERITNETNDEYISEGFDLLDELEQSLIILESEPTNTEKIHQAFRALHTFKGNSGLMGYKDLERLSHRTENFLDNAKNGLLKLNKDAVGVLLSILDVLKEGLVEIEKGGNGTIPGCEPMINYLADVINDLKIVPDIIVDDLKPIESSKKDDSKKQDDIPDEVDIIEPIKKTDFEEINNQISLFNKQGTEKLIQKDDSDDSKRKQYIKVDIDKVGMLVDWVGELVTAQVMLVDNPDVKDIKKSKGFQKAAYNLSRIVSEIQNVSMTLRMIPIAGTFRKMNRLVHDISTKMNKKVKLEIKGEETEIDKNIVDKISDPLVHIVRNSLDHGLETPHVRVANGKDETGNLTIEAKNEGGEIHIIISDDGAGMDKDKIMAKAFDKGLVTESELNNFKDEDIYKLVFQPGFSTAEKVSEVSGRGVGMDVVKRNVEEIKGTIEVLSERNEGTTITLRIPLTMAIIEGMLVSIGEAKYTIPLLSIRELFSPVKENITVTLDGLEVIRVRDEMIPVIRLHEILGVEPSIRDLSEGVLITVEHNKDMYCLFVDSIIGQQQAVMKSLPEYIKHIQGVSGCTILGDGRISPIVDIRAVIRLANINIDDRIINSI